MEKKHKEPGQFKNRIKELFKSKYFYIGLVTLLFGYYLTCISSIYLFKHYPNLPVLHDIILDRIPFYNIAILYDIFNALGLWIFAFYAYFKEYKKIPYFIFLFGAIYIIRAVFMILTPFANPDVGLPNNGFVSKFESLRYGVYPSGHVGANFLSVLLVKGWWKALLLLPCLIVIITLLLSRGHYSVDIFSAIIFAYATYCFGEKHLLKKFSLKKEEHSK